MITRRTGEALRLIILKYRSCESALAMVNSSPSAVESAAASPPAATRPVMT
jgi:hypothetical protein